ncbi:MAG TPA: DNA polymerase IV, partial [Marmoricola sp.]|nr:DNA polymerase IV [Marmoricola sp.]
IMHVDMDAFFVSVSTRHQPRLQQIPVAVGGGIRGVVLAANYPARRHGLSAGISMTRAHRLCPDLTVLPPDYQTYEMVSRSVMQVLREVSPVLQMASMDEAFLDLTGTRRRYAGPVEVAEMIRARIADEQQIPCSIGIAGSVSMAKLASRRAKPDGVFVLPPEEVVSLVHPLDVGELHGVGERTRERLHQMGLVTVGDVAHTPIEVLQRILGAAAGLALHHLAWGTDQNVLSATNRMTGAERSIGSEETFGRDIDDPVVVQRELLRLSNKVGYRVRAAGLVGRSVVLKIRFSDFSTITRSRVFPEATDVTEEIYALLGQLFAGLHLQRARIRLLGVRLEGLIPKDRVHRQLVLGAGGRGWEDIDAVRDAVATKYGQQLIAPAALF